MSRRYTYSRTIHTAEGAETFTADQFDSFDEAKKAVDKGIHDRKLELKEKYPIAGLAGSATLNKPVATAPVVPEAPKEPEEQKPE